VLPAPKGEERLTGTSSPDNTSESLEGVEEDGVASWAIFQTLMTPLNSSEAII